jgi:hypothetical protein
MEVPLTPSLRRVTLVTAKLTGCVSSSASIEARVKAVEQSYAVLKEAFDKMNNVCISSCPCLHSFQDQGQSSEEECDTFAHFDFEGAFDVVNRFHQVDTRSVRKPSVGGFRCRNLLEEDEDEVIKPKFKAALTTSEEANYTQNE